MRNFEKWAVLSRNEVDLLMLRNRVFMVRNAEILRVLSSNEADLLMKRNRVFSLRNVQIWALSSRKDFNLLILRNRLEAWKISLISCYALLGGRFADDQKSRIHAANRSKMCSASPPLFNLLMLRNRLCRLRNIQMWAVPS